MFQKRNSKKELKSEFCLNFENGSISLNEKDIFLTSYPKSGNTWIRFLIANLISKEEKVINFSNINDIVPDIYKATPVQINSLSKPRIIKSHEHFDSRYKKIIYIVRNPFQVAVSYYHHLIKFNRIEENYPFKKYLVEFLEGEVFPKKGNWNSHVMNWLQQSDNSGQKLLLIRYEDMV